MGNNILLEQLIKIQNEKGLNDTEFARQLGISRPQWSLVKIGVRNIGEKTLSGILLAFPQLYPDALIYLRNKNGD